MRHCFNLQISPFLGNANSKIVQWTNPALCVKISTGYATVNGSDTTGPPSDVVPPSIAASPDVKLGSVIMSILDSPSSDDNILHDSVGSTTKKTTYGSFCDTANPCLPAHNWYCYPGFVSCAGGKPNVGPGCAYLFPCRRLLR
jgi:hypothetical protein